MVIEVFNFIFSSFWVWLGMVILLDSIFGGLTCFINYVQLKARIKLAEKIQDDYRN